MTAHHAAGHGSLKATATRLAVCAAVLLTACGGGEVPQVTAASRLLQSAGFAGTPWLPGVDARWQWQLTGRLNTSYDVAAYDIDLFDTPVETIASLHAAGRKVVCYFSAGSAENWRLDYSRFLPEDLGSPLDGWAGEVWLDTRSANVRSIMQARLDVAVSKGCDAVEPDNVDAYANRNNGFDSLTYASQLDYNRFLADAAHVRGLAIALKNDVEQLADLEPSFDFAVNEQCHQYNECGGYSVFTKNNKAVFNAEYAKKYRQNIGGARDVLCAAARAGNMRTLVLSVNLDDSFRYSCD
jgi:hypothetical protein